MSEYIPVFMPGQAVTFTASEAVKAGQLVEVSGAYQVKPAVAASVKVVGVAGRDTAAGGRTVVYTGGVQKVTAEGAVNAGDRVAAAAGGKVKTSTTAVVGVALTAATGQPVEILFF